MKRHPVALVLAVALALLGCLLAPVTADAATTPLPRIAITDTAITDSSTGTAFVQSGANYIRLRPDGQRLPDGTLVGGSYIATFEPGLYDRNRIIAAADALAASGYKLVRTFVDEGRPLDWTSGVLHGMGRGVGDTRPVNGAYLDNLADFVKIMARRGIYTIPVTYRLPQNCYYYKIIWNGAKCSVLAPQPKFEGRNAFFLDGGFIKAKQEYLKQFATALTARLGKDSTAIYAYQSENEAYYDTSKGPWSSFTGTVTSNATGYTYDLAVPADRQQLADASFVKYTIAAKAGLLAGDPNAKLMIGVYGPRAVGKAGFDGMWERCTAGTDCRYPVRALVGTIHGDLDLVDIHVYPRPAATGYLAADDLRAAEVDQYRTRWIMGEIGAYRAWWGNDITAAAAGLRAHQLAACAFGSGSAASLTWTWDTDRDGFADQAALFHLTTDGGVLNEALKPSTHPRLCAA